jgi:hypothetical protein
LLLILQNLNVFRGKTKYLADEKEGKERLQEKA